MTKREVLSFVEGLGVSAVGFTSAERLADLPMGPVLARARGAALGGVNGDPGV